MRHSSHHYRSFGQPIWTRVRKHWPLLLVFATLGILAPVTLFSAVEETNSSSESIRKAAQASMQNGNFKDAYEGFRRLALDKNTNSKKVGDDFERGLQCLRRLNRTNETDAFREATIEAHEGNWRLLQTAAKTFESHEHYGYMISGQFERGQHRGGGKVVSSLERDRVRSLQLMTQAMGAVADELDRDAAARFYVDFAQMILGGRGYRGAWRLQALTHLDELPDYEPGWPYGRGQSGGAPVDADGKPIFHETVKTWGEAKTDGERWRYCLDQAVVCRPHMLDQTRRMRADFLRNQFGVQTMAYYGRFFGRQGSGDSEKDQSGTYALHTLGENETIAKLAVGVRRFELPDEHNFIKLYQLIIKDPKAGHEATPSHKAVRSLAELFENRRQYPRAAEFWRKAIELKYEPWKRDRLQQIVGVWGRFEPTMTQPAGKGAMIEFRFRNGKHVEFTAHNIHVKQLLDDVKSYLKSNPGRVDWQKVNIGDLGRRLVTQNEKRYRGRKVAEWKLDLNPRDAHLDRRITVTTPLQKAGAYLLKAKMADGNVSQVVVWLTDTAIVKKPLDDKALYYVADAVTGQPIAKANLELFGYRVVSVGKNRYSVDVKQFAEFTNADGLATQPFRKGPRQRPYQWIATATTEDGRLAYLGYTNVWSTPYREEQYRQTKVFTITDRPVYRPNQKVHYKFWVRRAQYDQEDVSQFAGRDFTVEIYNPKNEKILTKNMTADEYGGLSGELELPGNAALGVYRVSLKNHGGGTFRVEEYKKPEFEVTVEAPDEPVSLGEKITATIRAKYYFGSPVNEAKVKYKILRTAHNERWYPHRPWDWLYGRGYGWFSQDYSWYPGWSRWGCGGPYPHWSPQRHDPPEVIAEQTTEIGEDGTVTIEIDTALAKAVHGDQNHRYEIVAEVTDRSRRTIVGRGQILVAREPFRVTVWTQRGYYRVGDTIDASFSVRTIDNKPVSGEGQLELLSIRYDEQNQPVETVVETWKLDPDAEGSARQKIAASSKGQFRLRYRVTDKQGHTIEGGQVFTVIGEGFDGREFRFNDLELITDRREYQAGDTVRLQVNTNRVGAAVLLFVRPSNGVYLPPKLLRLTGKSTVVDIGVTKKDMPNFFVEAVTVHGGRLHSEMCEVYVPPEKRILEVEVLPSEKEFKPGERGKITVKLTDLDGKPFVGSTVLAMYDKSVEYISGGSNVGDIKEFFWKWRRRHSPRNESNLGRWFRNLALPKKKPMSNIGVFGATAVDELKKNEKSKKDAVFSFNVSLLARGSLRSRGGGRRRVCRSGSYGNG